MKKWFLKIFICLLWLSFFGLTHAFTQDEKQNIVNLHNTFRSEVFDSSKYPLEWDEGIANEAQNWANYLAKNFTTNNAGTSPHTSNFQIWLHNDISIIGQGENIAWWSPTMDIPRAINLWGSEKQNYDITSNSCTSWKSCGHYTQIVWQNTTKIGCGIAKSTTTYGGEWVVCRYKNAGNYVGQKPYIKDTSYVPTTLTGTITLQNSLISQISSWATLSNTPNLLLNIPKTSTWNNLNYDISRQAIMEKTYIRDNFDNWVKMNQQIADLFTKLRANNDTKTLQNLKTRLSPLLKQLSAKPTRSLQEEKIYHLASYLFYRATLELGQ